jgi:dihydroflavonol-4-reductase
LPNDLVFLTGATGFIGGHVARELRRSGYRVRALAHTTATQERSSKNAEAGASASDDIAAMEWVVGDVRRAGELVRAMDGCRYLIHCAALYSFAPRDRAVLRAINVGGTVSMLEAARIAGIERAVVTSSSATVGPARDGKPATEADMAPASHGSAYHLSKLEQERAAIAARVPVVLLLPTAPVGPGDWKPTPTGRLVLDFARGRMMARPSAGGLNLVAVEDIARAHVAALERGGVSERYLAGGENLSFDEVWEMLAEVTGRPAPRWRVPHSVALSAAYVDEMRCRLQRSAVPAVPLEGVRMSRERMYVDSTKAARELGYRAGSVRDALARAVAWYRTNGYVS